MRFTTGRQLLGRERLRDHHRFEGLRPADEFRKLHDSSL
jgi:hypothetical protein